MAKKKHHNNNQGVAYVEVEKEYIHKHINYFFICQGQKEIHFFVEQTS